MLKLRKRSSARKKRLMGLRGQRPHLRNPPAPNPFGKAQAIDGGMADSYIAYWSIPNLSG